MIHEQFAVLLDKVAADVERRKLAQAEADKERGSSGLGISTTHTTNVAIRFEESRWQDTYA